MRIAPETAARCWQRGIALYYLGSYTAGAAQFVLDMDANGADVEEVVWAFMCNARQYGSGQKGIQAARTRMLAPKTDTRVPMQQILALYAGEGTMEDVYYAADRSRTALAYANFYGGIFKQLQGSDADLARIMLDGAAAMPSNDYMGQLMVMHASLLSPDTTSPASPTTVSPSSSTSTTSPPVATTSAAPTTSTLTTPSRITTLITRSTAASTTALPNHSNGTHNGSNGTHNGSNGNDAEKKKQKQMMFGILGAVGGLIVAAVLVSEVAKWYQDRDAISSMHCSIPSYSGGGVGSGGGGGGVIFSSFNRGYECGAAGNNDDDDALLTLVHDSE